MSNPNLLVDSAPVKTLTDSTRDQINYNNDTGQWGSWLQSAGVEKHDLRERSLTVAVMDLYAAHAATAALWVEYTDGSHEVFAPGQWPSATVSA